MLIVRVELESAVTGKTTEIGRMEIWNNMTGTKQRGNYGVVLYRRGAKTILRGARVLDHPRLSASVWKLVAKAISAVKA